MRLFFALTEKKATVRRHPHCQNWQWTQSSKSRRLPGVLEGETTRRSSRVMICGCGAACSLTCTQHPPLYPFRCHTSRAYRPLYHTQNPRRNERASSPATLPFPSSLSSLRTASFLQTMPKAHGKLPFCSVESSGFETVSFVFCCHVFIWTYTYASVLLPRCRR